MKNKWLLVVLIILVASVFRLQHIASIPPGLYPDEAIDGTNAIQALENVDFKVFYPENNGREGLFMNLQALSIKVFGIHIWSLRVVSAVAGILTVLGLYLLATQLFNWQIGALSSYLLAISFWHVNFSRISFRAILAPMFLVWGLYYFWRGLSSSKFKNFVLSGIFWGLGFYTYIAFRIIPLALIFALMAYWQSIKKDFDHEKYLHARNQIARGLALFLLVVIAVALPIGYHYYTHQADFLGRTSQISVLSSANPIKTLLTNTGKTLAMFNFVGDYNWRHNLSGEPMLIWPIGILFIIGFFRSWIKLFAVKRKHGHFSSVHTLLLSWFFVGLLPVVLSNEGIPHALRALLVVPVVFIFAGEGLHWMIDKAGDWYHVRDVDEFSFRHKWLKESSFVVIFTTIIFLGAITMVEYDRYFNKWAKNPQVSAAFDQSYVDLGNRLNNMSRRIKKYVLVNEGGVLVDGIPMPAQTVMFVTDTSTPEKQRAKNIYYLTQEQYNKGRYDRRGLVIPLKK